MANVVVVVGSPRPNGACAKLARKVMMQLAHVNPEISAEVFSISDYRIDPCNGCEYCRSHNKCVQSDDMTYILETIMNSDHLLVITPVYFASVPSQFKALLDRFQPLFWKRIELKQTNQPLPKKRSAYLCVVGDGEDPHGYEPLVTTIRSALALADYSVDDVQTFIGEKKKRINVNSLHFLEVVS